MDKGNQALVKRARNKIAKRSLGQVDNERSKPNKGNQMSHVVAMLSPDVNVIPNLQIHWQWRCMNHMFINALIRGLDRLRCNR